MSFLPSLPSPATLRDLFPTEPDLWRPILKYHETLMRGPSPFSVAERELLAAYVSGLNACHYCHGVHGATAERFGVPRETLTALLADLDSAPVDEAFKAVCRYVRKLTQSPARVTRQDAEAVFAAGWKEAALRHAVAICALYNFMNRIVNGLGIEAEEAYFRQSSEHLANDGYTGLLRLLDDQR